MKSLPATVVALRRVAMIAASFTKADSVHIAT
jgi:hypothetical protein